MIIINKKKPTRILSRKRNFNLNKFLPKQNKAEIISKIEPTLINIFPAIKKTGNNDNNKLKNNFIFTEIFDSEYILQNL